MSFEQSSTDPSFSGGPDVLPDQKGQRFEKFSEVDLRSYNLRVQTLKLEYLSKIYAQHRDLSRIINPKRGFFEGMVPNWNQQIDYRLIMDSDPAYFADVLSAGMMSGMSSRSQPWVKLGLSIPELEDVEENKEWLSQAERGVYSILAESNIYDALQNCYEEVGIFSTGAFGIYEDSKEVARAQSYTIGEYFLGNDSGGRVNTFARTEWKTVDNIVNKWGWENCSSLVQNAYKKGQRDTMFQVINLCEPNDNLIPGRQNFQGKPFRSTWWEAKATSNKVLKCSGFNEFPIMACRWKTVTTADTYGCGGPGWMAKGDIKSLYRVMKDLFLAVAKVGDPPVQVSSAVEGQANLIPGGQTRYSKECPDGGVKPAYQINPDIKSMMGLIDMLSKKISSRFFADLFMMMIGSDNREMTAREVVEKQKDKLLLLGPVCGRIQTDILKPTVFRVLSIGLRMGVIPPPPPGLWGMPLKLTFIGLLAQAQKMAQTESLEQGMRFAGSLVGVFPQVVDNIDVDESVRQYFNSLGVDPKVLRAPDVVERIRAAQQKAMAAQQQQAALAQLAQTGKTLSETQVGAGASVLDHALGVADQVPQA